MPPRIHLIGVAPGAAEIPTEPKRAALSCEVLVGARRHLDLLPEFPGEVLAVEGRVSAVVEQVAHDAGRTAAFLASGDPGFFGIAGVVLRSVSPEEVRIWPAVSSMQLAFARAGETWSDARFASLHGRPLESVAPLLGWNKLGLFTDPKNTPAALARFLLDCGWHDLRMAVLEDLGLPSEKILRGAPSDFLGWEGSDLNVVLLLGGPDSRPLGPGLPDDRFSHSRGLITKSEVRAAALGLLRLPRAGVLWDVGAGSGSVAAEACLLASGLRAYAVEKSEEGLSHVQENRRRLRVAGLTPVAGEAPAVLGHLPDPDSVFVGGSGGRFEAILTAAWDRLRPGGALVVASVLVETLAQALAWAKGAGLEAELTEIRASRSRVVAGRHLLEPQNAVTLVRFTKPNAPGATCGAG